MGGGGGKGYVAPSKIIGGGGAGPLPPSPTPMISIKSVNYFH